MSGYYGDLWSQPAGSDAVRRRRSAYGWGDGAWGRDESSGGGDGNVWGGGGDGYYGGTSGNAVLDAIRSAAMADALGGISGARSQAMTMSPNDPSLAASAGLRATLRGQGQAARGLLGASSEYMRQKAQQDWQEKMMRAQYENAWIGDISGLAGTLGGAWLGRG